MASRFLLCLVEKRGPANLGLEVARQPTEAAGRRRPLEGAMTSIDLIFGMALVVLAGIYGIYWAEARRSDRVRGNTGRP